MPARTSLEKKTMHSCGHGNSPRHLGSSVDVENGIVRREIFTDRRIYDEEQEKIFSRSWLFVGHENQIASPGDYILGRMGEESVIVTRDEKGKIHVLLNNCRHRGMRVCRYDRGNTSFFSCPYHGWTFSNEGKLVKVPKLDSAYHKKLDPSKWGLVEARAHVHRGTIWATWNQDGPSFEEYMGSSLFFFDAFIGMYDGGEGEWEAFGGIIKWKIPCNWKFGAENFSGDYYHNFSHSSADRVSFSPSGQKGRHTYDPVTRAEAPYRLNIAVDKTGHTALGQLFKGDHDYVPIYQEMPIVEEYFRQAFYKRREKLKEKARWFPHHGTIFPNLSYSRVTMSIASWHPSGPNETEVWRIFLVPKDAPTEVKDVMRHYAIRYQGPAGQTEQDDMENWLYAHEGSRGSVASRYPFNYEMGIGYEKRNWPVPWFGPNVQVTEGITEQNQRSYFEHWAKVMDDGPGQGDDEK